DWDNPSRDAAHFAPRRIERLALQSLSGLRLQHDDRDLAADARLVRDEPGVQGGDRLPEPIALVGLGDPGAHGPARAVELDGDLRVGDEVEIPGGMLRQAALGRNDDEVLPYFHVSEDGGARLAAATTGGGEDQERQARGRPALPDAAAGGPEDPTMERREEFHGVAEDGELTVGGVCGHGLLSRSAGVGWWRRSCRGPYSTIYVWRGGRFPGDGGWRDGNIAARRCLLIARPLLRDATCMRGGH